MRRPPRTESGETGFLTPHGHRPPNSGVSPTVRQTRPFIPRTGSYVGLSRTDKRFYNVVHSLKTHHLTQAESKVVVKNTITGKDTRLCFAVLPDSHAEVHYFIFFISFECPENLSRGNLENQNYSLKMRLFHIQDSLILFPETSMPNKASNQRIYAPHSSMVKIGKSLKE